ncbi:NAD-dependent epimerase/dehydratase family protein [Brevundimonas sp. TWP2-3-4b1]|uniref:NAD-dependent epimerase/dehydratase family protein n=1 Tax=Brevundimonas sp. TWP2-3-4b1 TaxID=2804580 RepID=UPI003CEBD14B
MTGATGFVGQRVVAQLRAEGVDVVGAARGHGPGGEPWASFDLLKASAPRDLIAAVRPTHLIHLAWNATPGRFWTAPDNLSWTAASAALVRSFWDAGGERLVMAGSVAEYDWSTDILGDTSNMAPATLYGTAKDALRRLIEAAARQEDRSFAWGRIFWLYGPGEHRNRLVSDVAANLAAGLPVECSEGFQERDFLHVDDVASAFVAALRSDWRGPFNVASGRAVAVRDLIGRLGELSGRPDLIRYGARPTPANEPPVLVADVRALIDGIGFTPRWSLDDGLADAWAYWRAQPALDSAPRR